MPVFKDRSSEIVETQERGITIDQLGRMVANGFDRMENRFNKKFELVFNELHLLRDDIYDLKNTTKSHQQMLMDHESRIEALET